ncbi:MAG: type II secretion system GspH family protein [Lachnospiraceae bacterium]|nr:type II secretion system GspH family protein [Lachnospiraceae bacterium]
MGQNRNNKGFSLVELIIVIAIMAITIGVLAPQLIKYIEKAKVAADTQACDAIHSAIVLALNDPNVVTASDKSRDWIEKFTTPDTDIHLYSGMFGAAWFDCEFVRSVTDTLGYNPWDTPAGEGLKSTPASGHTLMPCAIVNSAGSGFAVYIAWSDRTGYKKGENFNESYDDLEDSKVIYVK